MPAKVDIQVPILERTPNLHHLSRGPTRFVEETPINRHAGEGRHPGRVSVGFRRAPE